jgi:hypothetical protein
MRKLAGAVLLLATGCSALGPQSVAPAVVAFSPAQAAPRAYQPPATTGIVIPLYVSPGPVWNAIIASKLKHSVVPFAIIANVDNGPGNAKSAAYLKFIVKAQKAGIDVLGYVYTQNGKRSANAVEGDIAKWGAYYQTDGVFLDQMAPNAQSYYTALTRYAHAHSLWFVMGNPGTNAPGNAGPDVINFYEQRGYPSLAFLSLPAHRRYGKGRWSYIAGDVPLRSGFVRTSTAYVQWLYATDGKEPECYCGIPPYFDRLVALLAQ